LPLFSEIYENGGTDNFFLVAALLFVYSQVKGHKKRVEQHFPTKAVLEHHFLWVLDRVKHQIILKSVYNSGFILTCVR
jgi:hypothetical protein